ncbi:MAG: DUF4394 domain-containing protein [Xanthomonadales bacterium]|nr:DUF4394 domain-containing protein [Xanthomonadales bacterium]
MMKTTPLLLPLLLSCATLAQPLAATPAQAPLDCAGLAHSAEAEPPGWAAQCAPRTNAPVPGPWRASALAPDDLAFAYNLTAANGGPDRGLHAFLLDDFPGVSLIGDAGMHIYALDFDPTGTILHAIDNDLRALGTLDIGTGQFTSTAPVSGVPNNANFTGLTIHPVTGAAYVSDSVTGGNSTLYSIDLDTGVADVIGDMGVPLMIDIAMNCAGELYGHSITTDSFYRIDPDTGAADLVGPYQFSTNFAQGMDFDNASGKLYASLYIGSGRNVFGTFDLDTGAFNPLSVDDPLGEWELAIPTSCENIFANGFESPW